jgi:large subunit ribosomal protein L18
MGTKTRALGRIIRHRRVRKKIIGTAGRPRLAVYRSLRHITAQVIDDSAGKTLCSVTTNSKAFRDEVKGTGNQEAAAKAGKAIGEKMKHAGITAVVFDRGGYLYHGRIKAFAEGAREAGIEF